MIKNSVKFGKKKSSIKTFVFSETDFVARNKSFHILLNSIVEVCLARAQSLSSDAQVSVEHMNKSALGEVQVYSIT